MDTAADRAVIVGLLVEMARAEGEMAAVDPLIKGGSQQSVVNSLEAIAERVTINGATLDNLGLRVQQIAAATATDHYVLQLLLPVIDRLLHEVADLRQQLNDQTK